MITYHLQSAPSFWKTKVKVIERGGKDKYGNQIDGEGRFVGGCVVIPRGTADFDTFFSSAVNVDAVLLAPLSASFKNSFSVELPESASVSGKFSIDGDILKANWGYKILLKRA